MQKFGIFLFFIIDDDVTNGKCSKKRCKHHKKLHSSPKTVTKNLLEKHQKLFLNKNDLCHEVTSHLSKSHVRFEK